MAFTSKLAELFVEFTAKGVDAVQKSLGAIRSQLQLAQAGAAAVGAVAEAAFARARLAVAGFGLHALYASAQGQVLTFHMDRLGRSISGLFAPEVQKAIDLIAKLVDKMSALTDKQRANIVRWAEAGAAALAVAVILPRVLSGVGALAAGVRALTAAFSLTSWAALLPVLAGIAVGMAALGAGAVVAGGGVGALFKGMGDVAARFRALVDGLIKAVAPMAETGKAVFGAVMDVALSLGGVLVKLLDALRPVVLAVGDLLVPALHGLAGVLNLLSTVITENTVKWLVTASVFAVAYAGTLRLISAAKAMIGMVKSLTAAVRSLNVALMVKEALSGPAGWAKLAAAVVATGAAIYAFDKISEAQGRKAKLPGLPEMPEAGRGMAAKSLGGAAGVEAMYLRIAETSRMMGKSPQERQADLLAEANAKLAAIQTAVEKARGDVSSGRA